MWHVDGKGKSKSWKNTSGPFRQHASQAKVEMTWPNRHVGSLDLHYQLHHLEVWTKKLLWYFTNPNSGHLEMIPPMANHDSQGLGEQWARYNWPRCSKVLPKVLPWLTQSTSINHVLLNFAIKTSRVRTRFRMEPTQQIPFLGRYKSTHSASLLF